MKKFWLSWYGSTVPFTLETPWWISGVRMSDDANTIVAALRADSEDAAKETILAAHDIRPDQLESCLSG